jgi:hypothetical protein
MDEEDATAINQENKTSRTTNNESCSACSTFLRLTSTMSCVLFEIIDVSVAKTKLVLLRFRSKPHCRRDFPDLWKLF